MAVSQTASEGVDATFRDFTVVPEPTTAALLALGALAACGARVRRRPGR
ncbi:MAG: PEP-CTERM sorting domain-containing protein [Limisphaerales bacterium]